MTKSIILLCCVLLVTAENLLKNQEFEQYLQSVWPEKMFSMLEIMLNEDGTGFSPAAQALLAKIEPQICPPESQRNDCKPIENWVFGCKCRATIGKLSNGCKGLPCRAFKQFLANGPMVISQLLALNGIENMIEGTEILIDNLLRPAFHSLCQCPKLLDASLTCAQKYDGKIFETFGINRTGFDNFVESMDWKSLKRVLNVWLIESWCDDVNGVNCIEDLMNNFHMMAEFYDNTLKEKDVCFSFVRSREEMNRYIAASKNPESLSHIVDAFLDMENVTTCDPECAPEIMERYYTCCSKRSLEFSRKNSMKQALVKVARGLFGEMPDLDSAVKKYLSLYNVDEFCSGQTDVYGQKDDVCDAGEV